jgi:hypothetical protein
VPGDRPGERCAAQPSGRPHEPSGDRRPKMDDHHRTARERRPGQNSAYRPASLTHPSFRSEILPGDYRDAIALRVVERVDGDLLDTDSIRYLVGAPV